MIEAVDPQTHLVRCRLVHGLDFPAISLPKPCGPPNPHQLFPTTCPTVLFDCGSVGTTEDEGAEAMRSRTGW